RPLVVAAHPRERGRVVLSRRRGIGFVECVENLRCDERAAYGQGHAVEEIAAGNAAVHPKLMVPLLVIHVPVTRVRLSGRDYSSRVALCPALAIRLEHVSTAFLLGEALCDIKKRVRSV